MSESSERYPGEHLVSQYASVIVLGRIWVCKRGFAFQEISGGD